jgi:hypothetical protein
VNEILRKAKRKEKTKRGSHEKEKTKRGNHEMVEIHERKTAIFSATKRR